MSVKIGLETHVQLNTKTKIFCSCSIRDMPEEPNTRCCPTCLGMPGSKPVLNKAALDAGLKIALALDFEILPKFFFSRKTYFYPDMAKNFQTTQYEIPLAKEGKLDTVDNEGNAKTISIERIHLEEDPAKLHHMGGDVTTATHVLVDYNRSGVPLCEIVTKPDFSSSKEVRTFLKRLSSILEYLGVFVKGEMSMRTDVNVSIEGGERVEIKNISSFEDIEKAIEYEVKRQERMLKKGEVVERKTLMWDNAKRKTKELRKKEFEDDYGYIFEPNLTKVEVDNAYIERIRKTLPELPQQKFERYLKEFKISNELATSITSDHSLAVLYEDVVKEIEPKLAATWMTILKKTLFYNNKELEETKLDAKTFVLLLKNIEAKKVSDRAAELILREIIFNPEELEALLTKNSKMESSDLQKIVSDVLDKETKAAEELKNGNKKALSYLIGKVMAKTQGKADAKQIAKILSNN
ncbi:MAG: Asp-tRNA(Asn)/Glu-tRNA(Gln) amidotransferase subunit GatB [Candidatus Aenigmarchaeota archaeon]|nr:Asp-tRNA(Asn)/Glu-tRNA(Gln) amidotransferase subunit GatB [Candidatus Aenigmarchaeota archaeon]